MSKLLMFEWRCSKFDKIPFPQRELSGRAETGGFRVRDGDSEAVDRDLGRSPAVDAPDSED